MDSEAPLVSIIVLTYQHADYIKKAIESILMQQVNFRYEVLIGEDDSNDGTREICKDYAQRYPDKIRLFLRDRKDVVFVDGKPTGRFNFIETLEEAKGKYVAMCDGDDYWIDPLKLQKQVDFLEANPTYSICTARFLIKQAEGEEPYERDLEKNLFDDGKPLLEISIENMFSPYLLKTITVVFRNMPFDKKFLSQPYLKDIFFWAKILTQGPGACLNFHGGVYRFHPGGVWSERSAIEKGISIYMTSRNMVKYFGTKYSNIFSYYLGSENVVANLLKDKSHRNLKEFRIYCRIKVNRLLRKVYSRLVL